jgi:multicomponent Na+:H+ antiporter subunit G
MIGEALLLLGAALMLVSGVGVVRFGDPLARMHALSKASTLAILLVLGGTAVNLRSVNDITSVVLAAVLHLITSPPASNMVSRATYLAGGMGPVPDAVDEGLEPLGLERTDRA